MIAGIFHEGSGLGNQLHRYVMTRVLALDKGLEFGMCFPENFKGKDFMNLNMGVEVHGLQHEFHEKKTLKDGNNVSDYDWDGLLTIKDNTLIDGEFQGEKYYEHHWNKIDEWLKVKPMEMSEDVCVIGFRGGEYVGVKDLFLPGEWWRSAIERMYRRHIGINFIVHTDDVVTAKEFFPDFQCIHDPELNWRSVRYAKHLIISNSSFYILPSLLNEKVQEIIAPKFWAGHNKGYWQLEQNQYERFTYI